MEIQRAQIARPNLKKKKVGGLILFDFKICKAASGIRIKVGKEINGKEQRMLLKV